MTKKLFLKTKYNSSCDIKTNQLRLKRQTSPDWCGSVGWESSCKSNGRWFDSVRAHAWVGGQDPSGEHVRGNRSMSLSPSLPLSLKIKSFKKINQF